MIKECIECHKEGKYKCPQCLTHNCSLSCYKSHKDSGLCLEYENKRKEEKQNLVIEDKTATRQVFTTVDTVTIELLEKLQNSENLKNLLGNKHLREFIREVDSARNPTNAMKLAMMEPLFIEFADECLKIVEPPPADTQ